MGQIPRRTKIAQMKNESYRQPALRQRKRNGPTFVVMIFVVVTAYKEFFVDWTGGSEPLGEEGLRKSLTFFSFEARITWQYCCMYIFLRDFQLETTTWKHERPLL